MGMPTSSSDHQESGLGWLGRGMFVVLPAGLLLTVLLMLYGQFGPLPLVARWQWAPDLGIMVSIRVDGLSALMLLLITGVGSAVFVYAGAYLAGHPQQIRLYLLLALFLMAMVGCVVSDHLILLFVFWELTSLTSFLLVGFHHESAASRKSAQQALLVTGSGGLCLLVGFLLLGQEFGTFEISALLPKLSGTDATAPLRAALVLIILGCLTKSAQFPFHFWLPNAMAAPTPVSAYLHSATMVKLGVYLLARLDPGFGEWPLWTVSLQLLGSLTAAWAMILAIGERDLKRILAWSTVATLGTLIMLIGVPGVKAPVAVSTLLLAHALYKAPLFFVAGNIDHGTGTRIIDRLGNLRTHMPWTALGAALAGFSMAGLPLTLGFVAKEVAVVAKEGDGVLGMVPVANTLFSGIAVAVAAVAAIRVFWPHPGRSESYVAEEGSPGLVVPPIVLGVLGILFGVFPQLVQPLTQTAASAMLAPGTTLPESIGISLFDALTSIGLTIGLGTVVFLFWDPLHGFFDRSIAWLARHGTAAHYDRLLAAIPRMSARVTRRVQSGRLPSYLGLIFLSVTAIIGGVLIRDCDALLFPSWEPVSFPVGVACAFIACGALLACVVRRRLVLLLASGLVGYGSAVLFLFTGAPDLAFTQVSVETLFVVVISAVLLQLHHAHRSQPVAEKRWRPLAALVAGSFGLFVALLMALAMAQPQPASLTDYFFDNSLPGAKGRNVVNVIIVDFRGLDTLGEGTVILLSFLAAWPILTFLRSRRFPVDGGRNG